MKKEPNFTTLKASDLNILQANGSIFLSSSDLVAGEIIIKVKPAVGMTNSMILRGEKDLTVTWTEEV